MKTLRSDPRTILEQYEALRREALEAAPFGPRGQGLALFLSRGMPDWVAALTALALPTVPARPATESPRDDGLRVRRAVRAELTTLLAGMVLACTQPREDNGCTAHAR
jgi:hypothetical protein